MQQLLPGKFVNSSVIGYALVHGAVRQKMFVFDPIFFVIDRYPWPKLTKRGWDPLAKPFALMVVCGQNHYSLVLMHLVDRVLTAFHMDSLGNYHGIDAVTSSLKAATDSMPEVSELRVVSLRVPLQPANSNACGPIVWAMGLVCAERLLPMLEAQPATAPTQLEAALAEFTMHEPRRGLHKLLMQHSMEQGTWDDSWDKVILRAGAIELRESDLKDLQYKFVIISEDVMHACLLAAGLTSSRLLHPSAFHILAAPGADAKAALDGWPSSKAQLAFLLAYIRGLWVLFVRHAGPGLSTPSAHGSLVSSVTLVSTRKGHPSAEDVAGFAAALGGTAIMRIDASKHARVDSGQCVVGLVQHFDRHGMASGVKIQIPRLPTRKELGKLLSSQGARAPPRAAPAGSVTRKRSRQT